MNPVHTIRHYFLTHFSNIRPYTRILSGDLFFTSVLTIFCTHLWSSSRLCFSHFYLLTLIRLIFAKMRNILTSLCDFVQAFVTCSLGLLQLSDSKQFESVETPYGTNYEGGGDTPRILISAVPVSSSHLDNIGPRNHWTRISYSHAGLCSKGSYGNLKGCFSVN